MRVIIIVIFSLVVFSCSESEKFVYEEDQLKSLTEIEQFILPDSLKDLDSNLLVAAFYEVHPKKACVVILYTDSIGIEAKKISFFNDSIFNVDYLIKENYNTFSFKDKRKETYVIGDKKVSWTYFNGNSAMTADYNRLDVNNR